MLYKVKEDQGHICFSWVGSSQGGFDAGVGIWKNLKPLGLTATAVIKHGPTSRQINMDLNDRWAFYSKENWYKWSTWLEKVVRDVD